MIYLTRRERFSAAHRLFQADLSDQENLDIYGPCANPNWHGHNYELFITIKGKVNEQTGYVVDLKKVSTIVKEKVVNKLDHKNINTEVDFMKNIMASTENLAVGIWNQINPDIESLGIKLHCVKLVETENNSVEYYGE
ncbi:MAG TPA: 6-carboxytetrahydropterin synthase [Bacteroidales bacterium]|nr:6-carboxytetrahydropterin synthase [Bacteroidales bacterium]